MCFPLKPEIEKGVKAITCHIAKREEKGGDWEKKGGKRGVLFTEFAVQAAGQGRGTQKGNGKKWQVTAKVKKVAPVGKPPKAQKTARKGGERFEGKRGLAAVKEKEKPGKQHAEKGQDATK